MQRDLVAQMKNLTTMSMLSVPSQPSHSQVRKKLNPDNFSFCFEIFGYDFIIDEDFKVWLIEVNTNPCLEESSKLLQTLIPRMLGRWSAEI